MTTHEYVARLNVIDEDKHLGITNRLIVMNNLKREYIASLEAENAKKDKLLDITLSKLAYFGCPSGDVLLACDKNSEDNACIDCWREYLGGADE